MPKVKTNTTTTTKSEPVVSTSSSSSTAVETKKKRIVRKSTKKPKTESETETVSTSVPVEEQTPVVETEVIEQAPVESDVQPQVEVKEDTLIEENSEVLPEEQRRTKRVVNKFKVQSDWEALFELYKEEIASCKKKPHQKVNFLKYLTMLRNDTLRVLKLNKSERKGNKNTGGFMKPVKISDDLADFIQVTEEERPTINRTEITKRICKYVKDNDLQKPEDRREIIPDETLKKLFSLQDSTDEKLTYYSIQKKVQSHIFKL